MSWWTQAGGRRQQSHRELEPCLSQRKEGRWASLAQVPDHAAELCLTDFPTAPGPPGLCLPVVQVIGLPETLVLSLHLNKLLGPCHIIRVPRCPYYRLISETASPGDQWAYWTQSVLHSFIWASWTSMLSCHIRTSFSTSNWVSSIILIASNHILITNRSSCRLKSENYSERVWV